MTADMALEFDTVKQKSSDHIEVALRDAMHRKMCSRSESKSKIEEALQQVAGRRIRIDFVLSDQVRKPEVVAPKLSRAQQIRKLNEDEFVRQAIQAFEGEITDFHEVVRAPAKR